MAARGAPEVAPVWRWMLGGVVCAGTVLAAHLRRRSGVRSTEGCVRNSLTLEGDYSLATIRERGLEHIVTARDLDGFFAHVWSVYPFVGADGSLGRNPTVGSPSSTSISPRHVVIEGTVAFRQWLRPFPALNFLLGQAGLVLKLSRTIRRERISVVRASEPYYLGLLGLLLARWNGRPFVVRLIANYDADFWDKGKPMFPRLFRWRSLEKRIERYVLPRADLVAAGNEDIKRYALANGARRDRTTVFLVGGLIDPVHFELEPGHRLSVRPELGLGGRPVLICVSRLERVKHPEDVVRVLAQVRSHVPEAAAVLVGDGSMRSELEEMARTLGLEEHLFFVGNRDQLWISRALASASVVLSPLSGRALVEGALSGAPIVAYDIDWHSELIRSGETGLLVSYRDWKLMAAAVVDLLADPIRAAELGGAARASALNAMDPRKLMRHERDAYLQVLGGAHQNARADHDDIMLEPGASCPSQSWRRHLRR